MKVLFATMQYGRGYGQGTERYIIMMADGLRERGHDVAVLGGDPEHRGPELPLGQPLDGEPEVLYYPTHGWTSVHGVPPADLKPIIERESPDIIHVVNPGHIGIGLMLAAREMGIPLIITVVDFWWLCPKHILLHPERGICDSDVEWTECVRCIGGVDTRPWVRAMANTPIVRRTLLPLLYILRSMSRGAGLEEWRRWKGRKSIMIDAMNAAQAIVFLSEGARQRIGPRLNHDRTHSIIVGMEDRWFNAVPKPPGDGTPREPESLTLGFVGALVPHKGTHLIFEALHSLGWTKTRVRIAGGGTDKRYMTQLHGLAEGLNVEFIGRVPSSEISTFLTELDLMLVPSTWPENLPQTVLEAQAVGTPVIASNVDGIAEVISDPSMLFNVDSSASLAKCLADWAASPRWPSPAKPVRSRDQMVDETLVVYEDVLRGE